MQWYVQKLAEMQNIESRISVCGDDCAVCPRYLAETDEEYMKLRYLGIGSVGVTM